jgi:hypothetical protein
MWLLVVVLLLLLLLLLLLHALVHSSCLLPAACTLCPLACS